MVLVLRANTKREQQQTHSGIKIFFHVLSLGDLCEEVIDPCLHGFDPCQHDSKCVRLGRSYRWVTALEVVSTSGVRGHINKQRGQKRDTLVGQGEEKRAFPLASPGSRRYESDFLVLLFYFLCSVFSPISTSKESNICNTALSDIEYNIHKRGLPSLEEFWD